MLLMKQFVVVVLATFLVSIIIAIGHVQSQVVKPYLGVTTIVSGNSYGDGLPPRDITLNNPGFVKVAPNGEVFICDKYHYTIRKVMLNGTVSTIVGRPGVGGDSGEGGLAINSLISYPNSLDFTQQGEILLVDERKMKKIDKNGIITTIAGTGSTTQLGSVIPDGSLANEKAFYQIYGVAVHPMSGEIYFIDSYSYVVRKISQDGKLYLVAGVQGSHGYSGDGDLAINAQFSLLYAIVFNSIGELLIADTFNNRIRKIFTNGTITTIAGTGESGYGGENLFAVEAKLNTPAGLAINPLTDELFFVERGNAIVRKISKNGILSTVAGTPNSSGFSGDGGLATSAQLNFIYSDSITFSSDGTIYFTESGNNRIRNVTLDGIIDTFAGGGFGDGLDPAKYGVLDRPVDVSLTQRGDLLIVDYSNKLIRKLSNDNSLSTIAGSLTGSRSDGELAIKSALNYPVSIIEGPNGNLFIADKYDRKIRLINANNLRMTTFAGTGSFDFTPDGTPVNSSSVGYAYNLVFNSLGELIFSDQFNSRIRKLSKDGTIQTIAGIGIGQNSGKYSGDGGLAKETDINYPQGLVLTMNGDLIFVDRDNYRIRKIVENGTIITIAGNGAKGYSGDGGLAIEASLYPRGGLALSLSGDLYFTDNNAIRKIYSNGTITTISGGLNSGLSGDGGMAINATYNEPIGIAIDSNDNIYIADSLNKRVRKISLMCESPYYGFNCESFNCNGIKNSNPSVCSSRGQCTAPETCKCSANSFGTYCEKVIPVGSRSVRLNQGVSNRLPFGLISLLILILTFY